jgi:Nif-specific regulatory protein/two-component system response regulator HydG
MAQSSDISDVRALRTLNRVMRALLEGGNYDQLLDTIMGEVLSAVGAERGYLVARKKDVLEVCAVRNWSRDQIDAEPGEISRSIVRDVMTDSKPVLLEDAMQSPYGAAASVQLLRLASILAAPLPSAHGGPPDGVLYLEARAEVCRFSKTDLELVTEILKLASKVLADVVERHALEERTRSMESALLARHRFPGIVTNEPAMLATLQTVAQVASSDVPVLVLGESGTGKELVARALHLNSARHEQPFVAINCGAFAPELLESELFGHQKGAFTGATKDRPGVVQAANKGTLFLDELGEMPLPLQVKLLRTIQFGEYKPLGSDETLIADVRFVSATNRDLEQQIEKGHFRRDLLYRLNCITLELPPLRERLDDIPILFRHFVASIAARRNLVVPEASPELLETLSRYAWPGNVRELENEVERVLALAGPGMSLLEPSLLSKRVREGAAVLSDPRHLATRKDQEERQAILDALEREDQNRTKAAKRLGVSRETLRVKMRKHGID